MIIKVYFDEDAQRGSLLASLRVRGADILTSAEAGMNRTTDEMQLEFASGAGRVLFSFNVKDYSVLHGEYLRTGKEHAGIVLAHQQFSIGEQTRRLLRLSGILSAEEMKTRPEFLSSWSEVA